MAISTLRQGLLASALATGLLLSVASAQSGPFPEVKRDPFINNQTQPQSQPTRAVETRVDPGQRSSPTVKAVAPNKTPIAEPVVLVVPAPDVVVSGIVASAGKRQAILWTGSRSLIVSVGQQVADYRVKAIDAKSVTFDSHGKSFRVALGQES
jgi:type II secretory pathway component PulC